jgi:hypothetical protein
MGTLRAGSSRLGFSRRDKFSIVSRATAALALVVMVEGTNIVNKRVLGVFKLDRMHKVIRWQLDDR